MLGILRAGLINSFRGHGYFKGGRELAALLMALFTACDLPYLGTSWYLVDVAALWLGYMLWAGYLGGWGTYFAAFSGRWKIVNGEPEKEIGWIDRLGFKLFPWVSAEFHISNLRRGAFCMALRMLYAVPFFLYIGWRWNVPLISLCVALDFAALAALAYSSCTLIANKISRVGGSTEIAEPLTGMAMGLCVKIISWVGIASLARLV